MVKTYIEKMILRFPNWRRGIALPLKGLLVTGAFLVAMLMMNSALYGQTPNLTGTVPVLEPAGGFEIEGDNWSPNDWFPMPPAITSPTSLYDLVGGVWVPKNPAMTFWKVDEWSGKDPTVFLTSTKINDNPANYLWGEGTSPNKNEIQNAWVHFSYGSPASPGGADDLWAIFAADRMVTNGASYIDFEFLQNRIWKTYAADGLSGAFDTDGPHGGRTLGDILITLEFTQGGTEATAVVRRWSDIGTGYEYVELTPAQYLAFADFIYIANNTVDIPGIPYDVYGSNPGTYLANQWAEGAINLTQIMGDYMNNDLCGGISTVFIRTRTAGTPTTSELKDFPIEPIYVGILPDPPVASCPAVVSVPECNPEDVNIPEAYAEWKAGFSYTGGVETVTWTFTPEFPVLPANPECAGFSTTVLYTVTDYCGKVSTCSSSFTVEADDEAPVIVDITDYQLAGCNADWPAMLTTTWTENCGVGGQTSGTLTSDGGVDVITNACIQTRVYTFSATDDCGNAANQTVTVSRKWDMTAPVVVDIPDYELAACNADWPVKLTTTWTDNCGVGGQTSGSLDSDGGVDVIAQGCLQTRLYTFMATDDCGNSASQTVTVSRKWDMTAPVVVDVADYMLQGCNPDWPALLTTTWTDNCGVGGQTSGTLNSDGGVNVIVDDCIQTRLYTFTATDDCGNVATQTVTVSRKWDKTAPAIVDIPDYLLAGCNADWPVLLTTTWTENCGVGGQVTGTLNSDAGVNVIVDACIQTRLYTFTATDDCGNAATQTVTVSRKWDKTAPVVADVADNMLQGCNADWPVKLTTTWTDNCGVGGQTSGSLDSDGGVDVITGDCLQTRLYTFTATDDCGNVATQTVTVSRKWDKTAPAIADIVDYQLAGCNPAWPEVLTTTWTDNCGVGGQVSGTLNSDGGVNVIMDACIQTRLYTFMATDDCGNSASQTVTVSRKWDMIAPVLSGVPQGANLGCNPTPPACADFNVTASDNCDGAVSVTCVAGEVGEENCMRSQTFTFSALDLCGNLVSATATFTWKVDLEPPMPEIELTDLEFECDETVVIPVPVFTDNCDGIVPFSCAIVGATGEDCWLYDYPTGDTEICFVATDECGNTTTICITVTLNPCREFCTYTQGFYGSQKGTACNLEEQLRGNVLTAGLIAQGDLVLGCPGKGNTVTFKADTPSETAELIRSILPGGKAASVISGACVPTLANKSCLPLTKQGRLSNQLLAQTLVLGLNLRITPEMGDLNLVAGKWLATQKKSSCEKYSPAIEMVCTPVYSTVTPTMIECYKTDIDPYEYYWLPEAVLCYMEANGYTMNVAGLYKLANEALGQKITLPAMCDEGQVTLTAISSAVDILNNAFDECRIFAGWVEEKFACPNPCAGAAGIGSAPKSAVVIDNQANSLKIYPNPFSSKVTFEFVPVMDAHAQLEIQNVLGQRVTTLMNRNVEKGVLTRVEFQPDNLTPGILIYRLLLDDQVQTGRIVFKK